MPREHLKSLLSVLCTTLTGVSFRVSDAELDALQAHREPLNADLRINSTAEATELLAGDVVIATYKIEGKYAGTDPLVCTVPAEAENVAKPLAASLLKLVAASRATELGKAATFTFVAKRLRNTERSIPTGPGRLPPEWFLRSIEDTGTTLIVSVSQFNANSMLAATRRFPVRREAGPALLAKQISGYPEVVAGEFIKAPGIAQHLIAVTAFSVQRCAPEAV